MVPPEKEKGQQQPRRDHPGPAFGQPLNPAQDEMRPECHPPQADALEVGGPAPQPPGLIEMEKIELPQERPSADLFFQDHPGGQVAGGGDYAI